MDQTTSTNTTSTTRMEALNKKLRDCKPYAAFVAVCGAHGHRWMDDSDIQRFEAAAAGIVSRRPVLAEELDASNTTSKHASWMFCAKALLDGRLQFLSEFPLVEGEDAGYFDEEESPVYELRLWWRCEADALGSLAKGFHYQSFTAEYKTAKSHWDAHVVPGVARNTGKWRATVQRFKRGDYGMLKPPEGAWTLGPFEDKATAQEYAERFLLLRADPATWRTQMPVIEACNFGDFRAEQLDSMFERAASAKRELFEGDLAA